MYRQTATNEGVATTPSDWPTPAAAAADCLIVVYLLVYPLEYPLVYPLEYPVVYLFVYLLVYP